MNEEPKLEPVLRDPLPHELWRLLRRVRKRELCTVLEQVAHEVGPKAYADIQCQMMEVSVLIRGGRIIGLPPGSYATLLEDALSRLQRI